MPFSEKPVPGSLDGKVVEVESTSPPSNKDEQQALNRQPIQKRRGVAIWDETQQQYSVVTFNGEQLQAHGHSLTECDPGDSETGGFDVVWPGGSLASMEEFEDKVTNLLGSQQYCVIQGFGADQPRKDMVEFAKERDYTRPKLQFEDGFLGFDAQSKISWLNPEKDAEEMMNGPLSYYMEYILQFHVLMEPACREAFGFTCSNDPCWMIVRQECLSSEEHDEHAAGPIDYDEVENGAAERYIDFQIRRRFCILYVVQGEGTVELHPERSVDKDIISIQVDTDKMLVFRHDKMSYSLRSGSNCVIVQAWIAEEPVKLALNQIEGDADGKDECHGLYGRPEPVPANSLEFGYKAVQLSTINVRYGGLCNAPEKILVGYTTSLDATLVLPQARFDLDIYYSEVDGEIGKTRTKHSSILSLDELVTFDNEFFGIDYGEAATLPPQNRLVMENGYETLFYTGYRKKDLEGKRIGHFLAHSSDVAAWSGRNAACMFSHWVGMIGRAMIVDTACSSAMVSFICAHEECSKGLAKTNLVQGVMCLLDIGTYVAMSSGRMISFRGRSRTFDHSADGYGRGEGISGAVLDQVGHRDIEAWINITCSAMNQDGRSASITAPSGPSQTEIIKKCMHSSGLTGADVTASECHGTGTTLGDPIEVGSMIIAMAGTKIPRPISYTGAKPNIGHLEHGAGLVGVIKAAMMQRMQCVQPQNHIYQLNEHFALDGFPQLMPSELFPTGKSASNIGASSFGFGGTNARVDCWGAAKLGAFGFDTRKRELDLQKLTYIHIPCPRCEGPMCWLCKVAVPSHGSDMEKHRCCAVRADMASYDYCSNCYEGAYLHGAPHYELGNTSGDRVYIVGSWTGWKGFEEMVRHKDGYYESTLALGDTLCEQFYIALDRNRNSLIFPVVEKASAMKACIGPDTDRARKGRTWMIDGRDDEMIQGTVYTVRFEWSGQKKVSWAATDQQRTKVSQAQAYQHTFSILGSWNAWQYQDMEPDNEDPSLWEVRVQIGIHRMEEFQFVRDHDKTQAIYPATNKPADSGIPIHGPDDGGVGKNWVVHGKTNDIVRIQLHSKNGHLKVSTHQAGHSPMTWRSLHGREKKTFWLISKSQGLYSQTGELNFTEMVPDPVDPGLYAGNLSISEDGNEEFQIWVNQDKRKVMYPAWPKSSPGDGHLCGPDAEGHGFCWEVTGWPGRTVGITLDLFCQDRRRMVTGTYSS